MAENGPGPPERIGRTYLEGLRLFVCLAEEAISRLNEVFGVEETAAENATDLAGIVYRSAALHRRGFSHWSGPHQRWSELVIFVSHSQLLPSLNRGRDDLH